MYIETPFDARSKYTKGVFNLEVKLNNLMLSLSEEEFKILKDHFIKYNYENICNITFNN